MGLENVNESFNTQPPEGGWDRTRCRQQKYRSFNTQPPEGGWRYGADSPLLSDGFNTQPPEGGWGPLLKALLHQVSQP